MTCSESARSFALEKAEDLETKADRFAILRSVDATEAAQWLRETAAAIREACGTEEVCEYEPHD